MDEINDYVAVAQFSNAIGASMSDELFKQAVIATLDILLNRLTAVEENTSKMANVATDIGKFAESFGSSKMGKMFGMG